MPLRLLASHSEWMHLWLFVFLRNSNLFQSSSSLLGGKVVASQCTASLSWSECSRRGGLMPTILLCNHSHRVTVWRCGQGSQYGAKHQDRQPRFSWQGGLGAGWGLPSQRRRANICIWSLVAQCWVPPTNRPRQEPLLFITPGSNLCRDELSIGTVDPAPQGTTTGSASGRNCGRGYASKFLFSLPASSDEI